MQGPSNGDTRVLEARESAPRALSPDELLRGKLGKVDLSTPLANEEHSDSARQHEYSLVYWSTSVRRRTSAVTRFFLAALTNYVTGMSVCLFRNVRLPSHEPIAFDPKVIATGLRPSRSLTAVFFAPPDQVDAFFRACAMQITINPFGEWRRVATVEASSRAKDLADLIYDNALKFRLVEADCPKPTFRRYDLIVDTTEGERRCARTTWAVLSAMQHAAAHGFIDKYRVRARYDVVYGSLKSPS